jgi:hypothetical protein
MTLELATREVIASIASEDLEALFEALAERAAAIESASPEEQLAGFEAGEYALQVVLNFRRRLMADSIELVQIEKGLLRNFPPADPKVDVRF